MKVLIVEDDPFKRNNLRDQLQRLASIESLTEAGSLQEAMAAVTGSVFDLVLLDMAIPSHAGGPGAVDTYSQPVGGLDILMHLAFNDSAASVIIMTQHPTVEYNQKQVALRSLKRELDADGINNVLDVIHFDEDGVWLGRFDRALGELN